MRMARCGALVLSEANTQAVKTKSGRVRWLSHRISRVNFGPFERYPRGLVRQEI